MHDDVAAIDHRGSRFRKQVQRLRKTCVAKFTDAALDRADRPRRGHHRNRYQRRFVCDRHRGRDDWFVQESS